MNKIQEIPVNKIKTGANSRLNVTKEEVDGLMSSIKEVGLLQPIGVHKVGTKFEVTYGNRRFMACKKLGMKTIPAMVGNTGKKSVLQIKNLVENVQRKDISPIEQGRYFQSLTEQGMTSKEISIKVGRSKNYIANCIEAFRGVPSAFRNDIVQSEPGTTDIPAGKISLSSARRILSATKTYGLKTSDKTKLFKAAKAMDNFKGSNVRKYAKNLAAGHKDFVSKTIDDHYVNVRCHLTKKEHNRILKEFIDTGEFPTIPDFFKAIIRGNKRSAVKLLGR